MRAVLGLAEVAIVLVLALLIFSAVKGSTRSPQQRLPVGGRWQPRHRAYDEHTVVTVSRITPAGDVLEEHVVARIPDSDGDWSRKFLEAKQEAEERAFHLNADSG